MATRSLDESLAACAAGLSSAQRRLGRDLLDWVGRWIRAADPPVARTAEPVSAPAPGVGGPPVSAGGFPALALTPLPRLEMTQAEVSLVFEPAAVMPRGGGGSARRRRDLALAGRAASHRRRRCGAAVVEIRMAVRCAEPDGGVRVLVDRLSEPAGWQGPGVAAGAAPEAGR